MDRVPLILMDAMMVQHTLDSHGSALASAAATRADERASTNSCVFSSCWNLVRTPLAPLMADSRPLATRGECVCEKDSQTRGKKKRDENHSFTFVFFEKESNYIADMMFDLFW